MSRPLTITELAQALGLSTCTVSRALNNTPNSGLSAATRQRVLDKARKLGYRPNLSAQALVSGKTRVLGAISINANNPFMSGFIYGLEETTRQAGYHVLLCNTRGDAERERHEVAMLRQRGVEGLVIQHLGHAEHLQELAAAAYPFVLLEPCPKAPELDYVTFDDVLGGRLATRALVQAGRRRIAHLAGPDQLLCAQDRLAGYRQELRAAGLPAATSRVTRAERYEDPACGAQAMEQLLAQSPRPDAVFCFNDQLAWGAYEAIVKHGLRVPEDIALIGYDDESFSAKTAVPLASIHLDTERLGREAATILLRKIETPDAAAKPQAVKIPPTLVWRASLGPAPKPSRAKGISR
ncbi:MAG: LacI family DNA-binding transcriptional regulator [Lentisphaeria bacterium]